VESLLDHIMILDDSRLLMDKSVADITDNYSFAFRQPAEMDSSVIYAEPSLQGNAVITRRQPGDPETLMNLELLFNATTKGLIK
jgi:ABC-2 type transport system ATP-binding protein